ncbi:hypothetical protein ACF0H5_002382 [Mactra antiquata]
MNSTDVIGLDGQYALLEEENARQFQLHLPAIIYTSLLMFIGTPGNVVVVYVYFFKWRKSTSRMFILFLTGLDLVNCCTTLPMEIYVMRFSVMLDIPWLCKFSRFSTYTMNCSSAAILVAIAIDRFRRICRPHGPQFTARKSKFICIGCIIVAFILSWPSLLFYGTRTLNFGSFQGKACLLENKYDSSIYPYVFFVILMGSTCVIFLTLSVLYYFVGVQVYKHRKLRMRRKAQSLAARTLIQNEATTHTKNNTLLQDSDSNEIKKLNEQIQEEQECQQRNENNIECHEMHELQQNGLLIPPSVTPRGGSSCTDLSTEAGDICINSDQTKRSDKQRFSKKKGTLKDSLTKLNGSCMQMKLRIGRSTLMLFLITLAYIVSFMPFYVIAIIRQTYTNFVSQLSPGGYMMYHVFLRSYLLSSAINPVIYSFCNSQFRTFCLDMFKKSRTRRANV